MPYGTGIRGCTPRSLRRSVLPWSIPSRSPRHLAFGPALEAVHGRARRMITTAVHREARRIIAAREDLGEERTGHLRGEMPHDDWLLHRTSRCVFDVESMMVLLVPRVPLESAELAC